MQSLNSWASLGHVVESVYIQYLRLIVEEFTYNHVLREVSLIPLKRNGDLMLTTVNVCA